MLNCPWYVLSWNLSMLCDKLIILQLLYTLSLHISHGVGFSGYDKRSTKNIRLSFFLWVFFFPLILMIYPINCNNVFLTFHTVSFSVSGLSGSTDTAQSQVSVGMGLLAGSTVMLITVVWASCVIIGKCDIEDNVAIDKRDTKGFSLTGMFIFAMIGTY